MLVIHNPTAGRRNAGRLWAVLDRLIGHGTPLTVAETAYAGHAARIARKAAMDGEDMVVAAGGDGTIAEVVAGLAGSDARLGIIPLGTANVLAHELKLPFHAAEIAAVLSGSHDLSLWPGHAQSAEGERLFVQMLGAGFDAHVVHHIDTGMKRFLGRGAYLLQTVRELQHYRFPSIRLLIDGVEHKAASVIVTKGKLYGGPYLLTEEARPDRPGFAVVLFSEGGIAAALKAGASLPLGKMGKLPGVSELHASTVEILEPAGLPLQADGDAAGMAPVRITDAAYPIMVAVPATVSTTPHRNSMRARSAPVMSAEAVMTVPDAAGLQRLGLQY